MPGHGLECPRALWSSHVRSSDAGRLSMPTCPVVPDKASRIDQLQERRRSRLLACVSSVLSLHATDVVRVRRYACEKARLFWMRDACSQPLAVRGRNCRFGFCWFVTIVVEIPLHGAPSQQRVYLNASLSF